MGRTGWYWNKNVASDGMTLDTARGPADLVAVERVLCGQRAQLSFAERWHLDSQLNGSFEQADVVAEGLGVDRKAVLQRHERAKQRAAAAS